MLCCAVVVVDAVVGGNPRAWVDGGAWLFDARLCCVCQDREI